MSKTTIIGRIIASKKRPGFFALAEVIGDPFEIRGGMQLDIRLGEHWIAGIIAEDERRFVVAPDLGTSFIADVCGLCEGMRANYEQQR